jgi:hypothetical protein
MVCEGNVFVSHIVSQNEKCSHYLPDMRYLLTDTAHSNVTFLPKSGDKLKVRNSNK